MSDKDTDKDLEKQPLTQEEADRIEKAFFEDGQPVRLRDGNVYMIQPLVLKQARELIRDLGTVDINNIALNFLDDASEDNLMRLLMMGFSAYPEMTKERLSEICDLKQAKAIFVALIDINGLKK